ncbi:hypothetical protein Gocc_2668 [Gaiella occulta]|uniref:Uncharacterized protein n=1 Tax=Gaiella occulta TaxID=1002870 RepID=A0A7M2YVN4_9ACTN|nr:hypothetical protein [Gaiella occulta]RDI73527.1 hypothetical protein Gocc_2668 [Gaiella occulta]
MTRYQIKLLPTLLAVLVVSLAASTVSAGTSVSQRVLLADYSLDSTPAERTEAVRIVGEMADLAAADQGVVAAAPFQASALATITWPILHRFTPKPSDPNSYYRKLDLAQQAEAVKQQAKTLFGRQRRVQGTDVLGGLIAASELFASEPAGPQTLVLNSNMWAYSPADGLILKKQRLSLSQITRLIDRLGRAGKIAPLRGVCVYVVGAGLDPGRQIPTSIQISMRAFWKAYFARAGAIVRAWTPTLAAEPSC